jgi:transcriptional regulator with XRE-family HTH domain
MTGVEFKARRVALGLSQSAMADRLRISIDTLQNWEQGRRGMAAVAGLVDLVLTQLEREAAMLVEIDVLDISADAAHTLLEKSGITTYREETKERKTSTGVYVQSLDVPAAVAAFNAAGFQTDEDESHLGFTTIADAYRAFEGYFGSEKPEWTLDQFQTWLQANGHRRYEDIDRDVMDAAYAACIAESTEE